VNHPKNPHPLLSKHTFSEGSLDEWASPPDNMGAIELAVDEEAPDFEAWNSEGEKIILSEILGSGRGVILYFYPRDNTPGCTTQACDFRDNYGQLKRNGWKVFGVSTDSAKSHKRFIEKNSLPFELIVDEDSALHSLYGTWREKNMYGKTYMGTLRSTFIIGSNGKLEWVKYGARAKGHVEELANFLKV